MNEIQSGHIQMRRVKCGKPNCKCATGGAKHTAFYHVWHTDGQRFQKYVRKTEVEAFSKLVESANKARKEMRQTSKSNLEQLREFRRMLRERQSFINSLKDV